MLLPALSLWYRYKYDQYLREVQSRPPAWLSDHTRKVLRGSLYRGSHFLCDRKSAVSSLWWALGGLMPGWAEILRLAEAARPPPAGCDVVVGIGDSGGLLADALMHVWRRRGQVGRSTRLYHMPVGGDFPFEGAQSIAVVDGFGYYASVLEDLVERTNHRLSGVWIWSDVLGYNRDRRRDVHVLSERPSLLPSI